MNLDSKKLQNESEENSKRVTLNQGRQRGLSFKIYIGYHLRSAKDREK